MLLALIKLLCDERLTGFAQDPLLYEFVLIRTIFNFETRRNPVDVLHQVMIEKWGTTFDRVRHLSAITDASKQQVRKIGLVPAVECRVERMPLVAHLCIGTLVNVLRQSQMRVARAVTLSPRREGDLCVAGQISRCWDMLEAMLLQRQCLFRTQDLAARWCR